MPIGTACYLFEWSIGRAHIQKPLATLSVFRTISHSISSWYNICIYFSPFIFSFPFLLAAQIGRLWSERYQSQQWQFNIERRNHIDTVQWKSRWPCRSNESPFRRKWFADYDDNEKQSFNCGNGGTKRKYTHTQRKLEQFIKRSRPIHFDSNDFISNADAKLTPKYFRIVCETFHNTVGCGAFALGVFTQRHSWKTNNDFSHGRDFFCC